MIQVTYYKKCIEKNHTYYQYELYDGHIFIRMNIIVRFPNGKFRSPLKYFLYRMFGVRVYNSVQTTFDSFSNPIKLSDKERKLMKKIFSHNVGEYACREDVRELIKAL